MKHKIYMATLALGALASSCADEFDQAYSVAKPKSLEDYAYLADYKPLRDYVTNPNFKLGGALEAGDFNNGGAMYQIAVSNFHEVVAGNAMKMASCVGDDGTMNFGTVSNFVDNAEAAGLSVFGHTLAWHAQQPKKWLENVVLADKPIEIDPNAAPTESSVKVVDLTTYAGTATHTVSQGEAGEGKEGVTDSYGEMHAVGTNVDFPNYIMGYIPKMTNEGLESKNPGGWYQYFIATGIPADGKETTKYRVKFTVKADGDVAVNAVMRWSWGEDPVSASVSFTQSSDFVEVTKDFEGIKGTSFDIIIQTSSDPTFVVKKVEVVELQMPSTDVSYWENVLNNSDCEGTDGSAFYVKNAGEGNGVAATNFVEGGNPGKCVTVQSATRNPTGEKDDKGNDVYDGQDWDAQFWIVFPEAYQEETTIKIAFDYKADQAATASTQAHGNPGAYQHWEFIGNVDFTTEWQHFEKTVTINAAQAKGDNGDGSGVGCKSCAFNLSVTKTATKYFFDNIEVSFERTLNGAAQTPEEKKDTLTWALDRWIGGMMAACGGKVKAWDVVNEAISGADKDGDGNYDLQHGSEDNTTDFFWQDYLGDVDYVRIAVASARKHFAANNGNAADLKLFVNDYNLESTWDDNKKLKSLINWIAKWEADGTTKIDGIGSQMHISFSAKEADQKKQEECIVNMLKLMAETGKLVRISELDMGYKDAAGISLETSELTEDQHKQMAEFYNFIVRKYLEIVPAAQQYGITQWCLTDSPANSGWRKNEPTGLWDLNYDRKHTYGGFADGLQGKEYSK